MQTLTLRCDQIEPIVRSANARAYTLPEGRAGPSETTHASQCGTTPAHPT